MRATLLPFLYYFLQYVWSTKPSDETRKHKRVLPEESNTQIGDDYNNLFPLMLARTPVRAKQQGIHKVDSGRKYSCTGNEGADILQGAGKVLLAKQLVAKGEAFDAKLHGAWQVVQASLAQDEFFREPDLRKKHAAHTRWNAALAAQLEYFSHSDNLEQKVARFGHDIRNIGFINKDMRSRMIKFFPPLARDPTKFLALREGKYMPQKKGGRGRPKGAREQQGANKQARIGLQHARVAPVRAVRAQKKAVGRQRKVGVGKRGHH